MPQRDERPRHGDAGSWASITATFTYGGPARQHSEVQVTYVPPPWLMEPALRVLADLEACAPIAGLQVTAYPAECLNGLHLSVAEPSQVRGELVELADDLDPDDASTYGGGNWVPRSLTGPDLLVLIADLLQEDLAESRVGWGQARPPCPFHRHPARPALHDGEAWWVCPSDQTALYRIGRDDVRSRG